MQKTFFDDKRYIAPRPHKGVKKRGLQKTHMIAYQQRRSFKERKIIKPAEMNFSPAPLHNVHILTGEENLVFSVKQAFFGVPPALPKHVKVSQIKGQSSSGKDPVGQIPWDVSGCVIRVSGKRILREIVRRAHISKTTQFYLVSSNLPAWRSTS
jgi:hypothetical protein